MKPILIVDDDPLLLDGYAQLCSTQFPVAVALSGVEALAKLEAGPEYAVILSDMSMPGMSGAQLLAQTKLRWPDTVRIMLTGDREQATAVSAVNQANVFSFLNKPCPLALLLQAVRDGARQHELIVAEKELLEKTLTGSVQILAEMLSVADAPQLVRTQKLRERAVKIARFLKWENIWEIEVAASLRQIGAMTIPPEVLTKVRRGLPINVAEQQMITRIPEIGSALLNRIPRLEGVARIVLYQAKHFNGTGFPATTVMGTGIPAGARLIKLLTDLINLEAKAQSPAVITKEMTSRVGWYDPDLLAVVAANFFPSEVREGNGAAVLLKELCVGQTLAANVVAFDGVTLVSSGYVVTSTLLERLENFAASVGVTEPIYVEVPQVEAKS